MYVLFKNGQIIDGLGNPEFQGDLLVHNKKIVRISDNINEKTLELNGDTIDIIDITGLKICPGFIDIHHHADLNINGNSFFEGAIYQGITTLAVGLCGIGIFPSNKMVKQYYLDYITKAFGGSDLLFKNYESMVQFIQNQGSSVNIAPFIPQGNIRAYVMGVEDRKASKEELDQMKKIVQESMKHGAFGISTGLVYPPGSCTPTEELIELCKIVADYDGVYASHIRNEGAGVLEVGISEVLEIVRQAHVRGQISHLSVISQTPEITTPKLLKVINQAREQEQLPLTADVTVYEFGATSLSFVLLNLWVYEDFEENLSNPTTREIIIQEIFQKLYSIFFADASWYYKIIPKKILKNLIFKGLAKNVYIISSNNFPQVENLSLTEAFSKLYPELSIQDALLDFLLEEKGRTMIRIKHKKETVSMIPIFQQDWVCPSSDGFLVTEKNSHPNSYGAFTRVLERWVKQMKVVPLSEAIRKMTSLPAQILGIESRGVLKEGNWADIAVFDFEQLHENCSFENGRIPASGMKYILVNGKYALKNGKMTQKLGGTVLNRQNSE